MYQFTKRALRSLCGKISREQAEDDTRKAKAKVYSIIASRNYAQRIHSSHVEFRRTKKEGSTL